MLSRDDIRRHLTSEMVFDGDRLPGFSDTIEHPDGLVLVDTGMIDTTPEINEDGEEWHPHPLPDELVSRVALVVNTHLHFDHCGGNRLFPGVPIHVQRRELADARTEDNYTVREWVDFPGATYVEHDGEAEILPGIRLLPAHLGKSLQQCVQRFVRTGTAYVRDEPGLAGRGRRAPRLVPARERRRR